MDFSNIMHPRQPQQNEPDPLPEWALPPDSRKRALSGADDASRQGLPHPTQRQPLSTIYNPMSLASITSLEDPARGTVPLPYAQYQTQLQQMTLDNIGPAAKPPLEYQMAAISNPVPFDLRGTISAKLDKLSSETIRALLLNAAVDHFTVADRLDLAYQQALRHEAAEAEKERSKATADLASGRFLDESWYWLTKFSNAKWSTAHDKADTVSEELNEIFEEILSAITPPNTAFETKAEALKTMAGIYDNIFSNVGSEIAKLMRGDEWEFDDYFDRALDECTPEDLARLKTHLSGDGKSWVEFVTSVQKKAEGYCSKIGDTLQGALDKIDGAGTDPEEQPAS